MDHRTILTYFSIKYKGDWDQIFEAIREKEVFDVEEANRLVNSLKSKVVTFFDDDYPQILKNITKPPFALFYHGDISLIKDYTKCVSVIGARENSEYGEYATRKIVNSLVNKEYITVSGLALGIDSIVHDETIKSGGKTVAILGCGINNFYLKTNYELYEKIKKDHLVISEYCEDIEANPEYFPLRNRIIAGLSKSLVVTEASFPSGTMSTVTWALNFDRNIFAVPYRLNDKSWCNTLIKDGAALIESADDI